jgi:hypothetical protein
VPYSYNVLYCIVYRLPPNRCRYYPDQLRSDQNAGESHYSVNKNKISHLVYPGREREVARSEEKSGGEWDRHGLSYTKRGGLVADPYMGSGSLGVWCAKNGRRYWGYFIYF